MPPSNFSMRILAASLSSAYRGMLPSTSSFAASRIPMLKPAQSRSLTTSRSFGSSRGIAHPRCSAFSSSTPFRVPSTSAGSVNRSIGQVRHRSQLAPRRTKYRKAHKGRPSIPTGGSTKGTTLQLGSFGLRVLGSTRLTAKQLQSAEVAIKRKIKPVKGAECWMRVFPDVPVCVKGNETRMGKGKGAFEYWACRVPVGRVVFEVGGGGIREEIAKDALRLASAKLPVATEFISRASPPRLGNIVSNDLVYEKPAAPVVGVATLAAAAPADTGLAPIGA